MSEIAESTTLHQLTLFAEDSLASLTVLPGSDGARKMTVTSGRNIAALLPSSGPVGLLLKTCLESETLFSTKCYLTWSVWTTKLGRLLFRLVPWMPRTDGNGSGLWATPAKSDCTGTTGGGQSRSLRTDVRIWPTPQAHDGTGPRGKGNTFSDNHYYPHDLSTAVMWPTPQARDQHTIAKVRRGAQSPGGIPLAVAAYDSQPTVMPQGGSLNPTWVEWLMGFPVGWTDLEPSETP